MQKELEGIDMKDNTDITKQPLTESEQKIYDLSLQGLLHKQIGEALGISRQLVTGNMRIIRKKLGK